MKKYILNEPTGKVESHIDFAGDLNQQQYEVVTGSEGPCLVLAGAGSGKTRTLIYRLAYLLERGVPPENILLMTFTNKAANEMKNRTEMLLRYSPKGLWSGTFHHIGNRMLRMYAKNVGYEPDFNIMDSQDSKELIKTCIKKNVLSKDDRFPKPSVVQTIISLSVNTKESIEALLDRRYPYLSKFSFEIEKVKKIYNQKKKDSNSMDYDDLLYQWKNLLINDVSVRERFTNQFHYVLVDEYQDTNFLQSDIIDILSEKHKNILAVGDDAQSIYSFRGARVENILSFPKKFSNCKIFKLETNYRSSEDILNLANDSLTNNREQFSKYLTAVKGELEKPALVEVNDLYSQARFVVQRILEITDEGINLNDIAILFRAHYQSAELEMELVKRGIPYIVRGGIRFFEQAHIKDVLSYLRILVNPADEIAWIRALTLCSGIGPGYAEKIYNCYKLSGRDILAFIRSHDISKVIPFKAQKGYIRFRDIMISVTDPSKSFEPGDVIRRILDSGYETHLLANFDNAKDRLDDIFELVNFSGEYQDSSSFLSDITLRESFKGETNVKEKEEDSLILSTIHQAKGLEWNAVMVIGLCEGQFPHPKSYSEESELEEERRLFYVAVTRAKNHLYLVHPRTRYDYSQGTIVARKSRFLEELNPKDYEVWEVNSPRDTQDYRDYDDELDEETIIEI